MRLLPLLVAGAVVWGSATLRGDENDDNGEQPGSGSFRHVETSGTAELHNVLQVTDRLLSGSEARGVVAFSELKRLGVTTVVSVDGAPPDVETARQFGIRYIHIPVRYDAIDRDAQLALCRVMQDIDGLIYVHCHHGTQRGPAAAAICALADQSLDHESARSFLKQAGASPDYAGLWRDVARFSPPAADAVLPPLVESADVDSLAAAMARAGRWKDKLTQFSNRGWQPTDEEPERTADRVALLLNEEMRESARNLAVGYGEDFEGMLSAAATATDELRRDLQAGRTASARERFTAVQQSCTVCHEQYRN